jgi:hypothetical protein
MGRERPVQRGPGADAPRDRRTAVLSAYRSGARNATEATESLRAGVEKAAAERFEAADEDLGRAERRGFTGEERFGTAMTAAGEIGADQVARWATYGRNATALLEASAGTERRYITAKRAGDAELAAGAQRASQRAARRAMKTLKKAAPPSAVETRLGLDSG